MAEVVNSIGRIQIDRFISDISVEKIRKYTGDSLAHLYDIHVREKLHRFLNERDEDKEEYWWEDDRIHGVVLSTIVKVSSAYEGSTRPFYAVLRKNDDKHGRNDKRLAVVTVVDEAEMKSAIYDGRWMKEKPEKSKHVYPSHTPFADNEKLMEMKEQLVNKRPPPEQRKSESANFYIETDRGDRLYVDTRAEVEEKLYKLLGEGVPLTDINVFERLSLQMNLVIGKAGV